MTDAGTDAIMRSNMGLVHYYIRRDLGLTHAHPDYEDAVQEGALFLWKATIGYDPNRGEATFATYASRAIRRRLRDWWIIQQRQGFTRTGTARQRTAFDPARPPTIPSPVHLGHSAGPMGCEPSPLAEAIRQEEARTVRQAVRRLSPRDQGVIVMWYFDGLSWPAIGELRGISRHAAAQSAAVAIKKLRIVLGT